MRHAEVYAPWATAVEAEPWLDDFQRNDPRRVWLGGEELGQRLNLTNAEREALKAWRIVPVGGASEPRWMPNHVKPMRPRR